MVRETPKRLIPVSPEKATAPNVSRCVNSVRWHKSHGISGDAQSYEVSAPGLQKCLVWDWGTHLEVKRLCVCPEFRGRGVGSQVMRAIQAGGKKIVLFPVSDEGRQDELERFYRRLGFRPDFFDPENLVWEP